MRMLGLTLALALSLASGASATPVITNGLVAAWEFSGNANDVSGNGNNGVVNGATLASDRFGNPNSAYSFDGVDDFIEAADSATLSLTTGMSAFAWVNAAAGINNTIISKGTTDFDEEYLLTRKGGGIRTHIGTSTGWRFVDGDSASTGEWHHVGMTYDGSFLRTYIDGIEDLSISKTGNLRDNNLPLKLGRRGLNTDNTSCVTGPCYWDGLLDDVYIYNRALSPTEVSTLYTAVPEPTTGLLLGLGLLGVVVRRRV